MYIQASEDGPASLVEAMPAARLIALVHDVADNKFTDLIYFVISVVRMARGKNYPFPVSGFCRNGRSVSVSAFLGAPAPALIESMGFRGRDALGSTERQLPRVVLRHSK